MILYAMLHNQGGLKRVVEVMDNCPHEDVWYLVFKTYPANLTFKNSRIITLDLNDFKPIEKKRYAEFIKNAFARKGVDPSGFRAIIGDYLVLPFFEFLNIPVIYDVHSLEKSLMARLHLSPNFHWVDQWTLSPHCFVYEMISLQIIREESKWLKKASAFIANSKNTERELANLYSFEVENKPVFEVPVTSSLKPTGSTSISRTMPFYLFTRWHPQKGLDLIFGHDWSPFGGLMVRGVNRVIFNEEGLRRLEQRKIHILDWTDDPTILEEELNTCEVVLFPSVYEPFGLALAEALNQGCLVIANKNSSGHEEQIIDGVNGFLIDMSDESWLQQMKNKLTENAANLGQIRSRAHSSMRATEKDRLLKQASLFSWIRSTFF
jgi:glycosyltransferase involved in cell wall biosynthesis